MTVTNDILDQVASEVGEYLTHYIDGATVVTVTPGMVETVLDHRDPAELRATFGGSASWVTSLIRRSAERYAARHDPAAQLREVRAVLAAFDWGHHDTRLALEAIERIVMSDDVDQADEPEPTDYDPGPEVDDEGGMSEHRYREPEPGPWS